MSNKIKAVLDSILEKFETGDIPEAVAISTFPLADIPSSRWSFLNRLIMLLSGTTDARGYRQWQKVMRYVKKGVHAFYILVPRMIRKKTDGGDEEFILTGFFAKPVFRYEDTAGQSLQINIPELPDLPLLEKAREWGISVKAVPGNYRYYGYYQESRQEIGMATKEESIFFHELAHAAHSKLSPLKKGQDWKQEIVAELCAAALCRIVGKTSKHLGNNYRYIKSYAKQANLSPTKACLKVLNDVENTLNLILRDVKDTKEQKEM